MADKLLCFYYNDHQTNFFYPEEIVDKMQKYGLPLEDCDVVEYDMTKAIAPYTVSPDKSLVILNEEQPPSGVTPMSLKDTLKEVIETPLGRELSTLIRENNKKLRDAGFANAPVEFTAEEQAEPVFYSIEEVVAPIEYMLKGVVKRNYLSGEVVA